MTGRLREDDDGHWFFVPMGDELEAFDNAYANVHRFEQNTDPWYNAIDYFEKTFGCFKIDSPTTVTFTVMEDDE